MDTGICTLCRRDVIIRSAFIVDSIDDPRRQDNLIVEGDLIARATATVTAFPLDNQKIMVSVRAVDSFRALRVFRAVT